MRVVTKAHVSKVLAWRLGLAGQNLSFSSMCWLLALILKYCMHDASSFKWAACANRLFGRQDPIIQQARVTDEGEEGLEGGFHIAAELPDQVCGSKSTHEWPSHWVVNIPALVLKWASSDMYLNDYPLTERSNDEVKSFCSLTHF